MLWSDEPALSAAEAEGFVVPVVRKRQVYENLPLTLTACNHVAFLTIRRGLRPHGSELRKHRLHLERLAQSEPIRSV